MNAKHLLFLLVLVAAPVSAQINCSHGSSSGYSWNDVLPWGFSCPGIPGGTVNTFTRYVSSHEFMVDDRHGAWYPNDPSYAYAVHLAKATATGQSECPYIGTSTFNCYPPITQQFINGTTYNGMNQIILTVDYVVNTNKVTLSCGRTGFYGEDYWRLQQINCNPQSTTPIIIDTDGHGYDLTSAENGVPFAIGAPGVLLQLGWPAPGSTNGFLALPAADGLVHSGQELFGATDGFLNGFDKLAQYDSNGDGIIDDRDAIFPRLRVWINTGHDGISKASEMHTLPSLGINSISLHYTTGRKSASISGTTSSATPRV